MPWCANDGEPATFQCAECSRCFCSACVKHGVGEQHTELVCPVCHSPVHRLERATVRHPGKTFWYYLATAFAWPLTERRLLALLVSALFIFLLLIAAPVLHHVFTRMGRVYGVITGIVAYSFAWGYLVFTLFRTTKETAVGHNPKLQSPLGPTPMGGYRDLARFIMMLWVCTLPAVLVSRLAHGVPRTLSGGVTMTAGGMFTLASLIMIEGACTGVRVVAIACAFFMPMALLTVASFGRLRGIDPIPAAISICRIPFQYLCCCIGFYVIPFILTWLFWGTFETLAAGQHALEEVSAWEDVTVAGALTVFFGALLFVYGASVAGRILGGLRVTNVRRLGWLD